MKGRKNYFEYLRRDFNPDDQNTIWMHCASLGEFEQGRPILKKIKDDFPAANIVITFFSPSGYTIALKDKDFKKVFYLPMDSSSNAKKLLDIIKPKLVLWVKYEYWYYHLLEIKSRNIPLILISGIFSNDQVFFKWYGGLYRKMLKCFTHFFVQNASSKNQLQKLIAQEKITISGDTRCDRVINIAENFTEVAGIADFCGKHKVIVAGSTWEDDEAEWTHFVKIHPEIKFIIAPHEIDEENLNDVKKEFAGSIFYSEYLSGNIEDFTNTNCLIIDNIGTLSRLYKYATIAYVGGGFGYSGLHNILEPAVYGKPVIFGPEFEKNFEAVDLINCSGAFVIENALELEKVMNNLLKDDNEIESRGLASRNYVYNHAGASDKIIDFIQKNRLLTN